MKTFLLLLFVSPLSLIAQSISGLPLHAVFPDELADLKGPQELIKGEFVIWRYPFNWVAAADSGQRVPISQYTPMRFIAHLNGGWRVQGNDKEYNISIPPNTAGGQNVFMFADIKILGAHMGIVKNRLGEPTQVIKTPDGTAFQYSKEVTRSRLAFDTLLSTTQGTIGMDSFRSTTTTLVPRSESLTYNAYSFILHFDSEGIVRRVEDLCTKTAEWER